MANGKSFVGFNIKAQAMPFYESKSTTCHQSNRNWRLTVNKSFLSDRKLSACRTAIYIEVLCFLAFFTVVASNTNLSTSNRCKGTTNYLYPAILLKLFFSL